MGAGEGNYVLKKDYVELKQNVQIYEVPANREINEVLWFTYIGLGSYYILPAFDILMRATDRNLKNRMVKSELIYKITNAPDGKKYIHLMNTPGSSFDFRGSLFKQGKVWYW